MNNYLLLFTGGSMPESQAERAAVLEQWQTWYRALGDAVVDEGNPFSPQAKTIASDGSVGEGAVGVMASGYSVIQAESLDQATEMARGCPVLKGGAHISVYETFNAM